MIIETINITSMHQHGHKLRNRDVDIILFQEHIAGEDQATKAIRQAEKEGLLLHGIRS